jgi:hypothetical protein
MKRYVGLALLAPMLAAANLAQAMPADQKADARTEAGVLAVDHAWGDAEANGDVDFVARLLSPGYRSIGTNGKATDREAILASTKRHGASPDYKVKVAAWRQEHPTHGEVALFGDTAILTWISDAEANRGAVQSCDIFAYREGHWTAVYSQHLGA